MKIRKAAFHPYGLELRSEWRTANANLSNRAGYLLELQDHEGATAWGDAAPSFAGSQASLARTHAALERLVKQVERESPPASTEPPIETLEPVRHAWSQAILTLEAQRAGQPLWRHLAQRAGQTLAPPKKIPVNATIGLASIDATVERAKAAVDEGYGCIKLKVGPNPKEILRVAAVRAAIGPETQLRLDANGCWTELTALYILQRLQPFNIEYVEQPLPPGRLHEFEELRRRSPIPFAADESAQNIHQAQALMQRRIVDVVIIKPPAVGGLDRALKLLQYAKQHKVRPVVTDSVDSAIGRTGALHLAALLGSHPSPCGLASGEQVARDVIADPPRVKQGHLVLPTLPGLGIPLPESQVMA